MELYELERAELCARLGTGENGLTSAEAARRLAANGANAIAAGKKKSPVLLFFAQFKDLMTLILIGAAFLSAALAFVTKDAAELADTGILLFVILLNAVVGFLQQYRADAALEKLSKMTSLTAKVVRDGKLSVIGAEGLVAGDVVEIEEGDAIPADCRVLSSENFRCDESALTGESKPVSKRDCAVKRRALAERENTAHFSCFCVSGRARCLVTATGMATEMGKIARLLRESKPAPSPLDRLVARLGKIVTVTVIAVAAVLFLGGLLSGRVGFLDNLMTAVAVAVAAIPEGMGAVVTIILAMGVQRMSLSHAVVRKLSAVETLGSCTYICSDKTGTLTENRMKVEEIRTSFSGGREKYTGTPVQRELLTCIRICHSVKGEGRYVGDPTEIALLEYADSCGFPAPSFERTGGTAFTSERRRMSVAARIGGRTRLYVKGGTDAVLLRSDRILGERGERPLSAADRKAIEKEVKELSGRAMRVLAFAYGDDKEENLVFLGVCAMLDPPKRGAREAVEACRRAGVRVAMITGDSAETAFAIASRLGIASRRSEVITGEELDALGDSYVRRAGDYTVYARVTPKHKTLVVRALQARGEIVAMTGDGVNDAPSIKAADIGVAMGSGTDVTKNASDMVIADDDFPTIVRAVEEGRNVFFGIKKTISFFLSTNFAEVLAVLISTLFLWKFEFLTSTQLLWINLITDSLPVLALGTERAVNVMDRPPVSPKEIFGKRSVLSMLFFGLAQAAIVIGVFLFGLREGNGAASTMAFCTLSGLELFHAFNVRKERGRLRFSEYFSNRALLATITVGLALNVLLVAVPFLRTLFSLSPLGAGQWLAVFFASVSIVPIGEIAKGLEGVFSRRSIPRRAVKRREKVHTSY